MSTHSDGTRRVVVVLDVPAENTLADVETDLCHYFAGVVSVEEDTRCETCGDPLDHPTGAGSRAACAANHAQEARG